MQTNNMVTPIFIFSLPRAGSTLLQRIIGAHESVSYCSEPWVLLPFLYANKHDGIISEYNHQLMNVGLNNFINVLNSNGSSYQNELKEFLLRLYTNASDVNSVYFVDKTPRYHYIANEIIETFPTAKFIFLWRNPLAVQASCIDTWSNGKWNIHLYKQDQYDGLQNLISAFNKHKDKCWAINYEQLVTQPQKTLEPLFKEYLRLPFDEEVLTKFNTLQLKPGLGDKTGSKQYTGINPSSLNKWHNTMSGAWRKHWCRNYLQWIGTTNLKTMGYNSQELVESINNTSTSWSTLLNDIIRSIYGKLCKKTNNKYDS